MALDAVAFGLRRLGRGTLNAVTRLGFASRFFVAVLLNSPAAFRRIQLTLREIYFAGALSLVIILVLLIRPGGLFTRAVAREIDPGVPTSTVATTPSSPSTSRTSRAIASSVAQ